MAASLYIVVEGEDPGFDIFVNGQGLAATKMLWNPWPGGSGSARCSSSFQRMRIRWRCSLSREPATRMGRHLPQPQWFSAAEGLVTIRALIHFLAEAPAALGSETQPVLLELREYERVLTKTAQHGLRWHLAVSWR